MEMINIMEILITTGIVIFTAFIIYRTINKSSKGNCNCGTCSTHCPIYKDNDTGIQLKK